MLEPSSTRSFSSKCTVNSGSYTWQIDKLNQEKYVYYEDIQPTDEERSHYIGGRDNNTYGILGLRSSECTFPLVVNGEVQEMTLYLWLTRPRIQSPDDPPSDFLEILEPWNGLTDFARLSLSNSPDKPPSYVREDNEQIRKDIRNTCTAWIAGKKKESIRELTGGVISDDDSSIRCLFSNPEFICYEDLFDDSNGLVRDGRLTITCQVHAVADCAIFVNGCLGQISPFKPPEFEEHTLASDLNQLRRKEECCDFTLVARDSREFPVHTFVLGSRSEFFDTMFKLDMKERREKRFVVDISSEAVEALLDYMYTDRLTNIKAVAPELLPVAHRLDYGIT